MRSVSTLMQQAMYASSTKEVVLLLLKISHQNLVAPIRVVNNFEPIVSQGYTWAAYPFEITMPSESDDQIPVMILKIDAVDRQIITVIRSLQGPPEITLDVILAAQPDIAEASVQGFKMKSVSYDNLVVEAELRLEEILSEPFPQHAFTPALFPGLFAQH